MGQSELDCRTSSFQEVGGSPCQLVSTLAKTSAKEIHCDEAAGSLRSPSPPRLPRLHCSSASTTEWRADGRLGHPQHNDSDASPSGRCCLCQRLSDRKPETPQGELWVWRLWPSFGL